MFHQGLIRPLLFHPLELRQPHTCHLETFFHAFTNLLRFSRYVIAALPLLYRCAKEQSTCVDERQFKRVAWSNSRPGLIPGYAVVSLIKITSSRWIFSAPSRRVDQNRTSQRRSTWSEPQETS